MPCPAPGCQKPFSTVASDLTYTRCYACDTSFHGACAPAGRPCPSCGDSAGPRSLEAGLQALVKAYMAVAGRAATYRESQMGPLREAASALRPTRFRFKTAPEIDEEVTRGTDGALHVTRGGQQFNLKGHHNPLQEEDVHIDEATGVIRNTDKYGYPITIAKHGTKRKTSPAEQKKPPRRYGPPKRDLGKETLELEKKWAAARGSAHRQHKIQNEMKRLVAAQMELPPGFGFDGDGETRLTYRGRIVLFEGKEVHAIGKSFFAVINSGVGEKLRWAKGGGVLIPSDLTSAFMEYEPDGTTCEMGWEPGRVGSSPDLWGYNSELQILYKGRPVRFGGRDLKASGGRLFVEADGGMRQYLVTFESGQARVVKFLLEEWTRKDLQTPHSEALGTVLPADVTLGKPVPGPDGQNSLPGETAAPDIWEVDGSGRLRYRGKPLRLNGKDIRVSPQGAFIATEGEGGEKRQFIVTIGSDEKPSPVHLIPAALMKMDIRLPPAEAAQAILPEGAVLSRPVESFSGEFAFPGQYGVPNYWSTGRTGAILYKGKPAEFQGKEVHTSGEGIFVTAAGGGQGRQYIITLDSDGIPQPIHLDPAELERRNIRTTASKALTEVLPARAALSKPVQSAHGTYTFPDK